MAENQSERRLTPRVDANLPATVWIAATHVGCTVQDVSWLGASLLVPAGITLPDAFELEFQDGQRVFVELIWRAFPRCGVRFATPVTFAADVVEPLAEPIRLGLLQRLLKRA